VKRYKSQVKEAVRDIVWSSIEVIGGEQSGVLEVRMCSDILAHVNVSKKVARRWIGRAKVHQSTSCEVESILDVLRPRAVAIGRGIS
jgi:hypothetical protein